MSGSLALVGNTLVSGGNGAVSPARVMVLRSPGAVRARVHFHLLGDLEVVNDGERVPVAGHKQRALLAVLLLRANEVVSADRLIEDLWGDEPPARAAKSVQVHVWRLRKTLASVSARRDR